MVWRTAGEDWCIAAVDWCREVSSEEWCREGLRKSGVSSDCGGEVLGKSSVEKLGRRCVEECWGRAVYRRVWGELRRKALGKSGVEKCWRGVVWSRAGEEGCRDVLLKRGVEQRKKCWGAV